MTLVVAACGGSAATGAGPTTGSQTSSGPTAAGATGAPTAGAPTSGAPKELDACKLLTAAEAATALGEPVDPGTVPTPGARSCLFTTTKLSTNAVEISITGINSFNPDQKSIPGLTITKVSGIGDAAYFVSIGAGYQTLNFRKGQTALAVSVILKNAPDSQLLASEKTLALAALKRI